MSDTLVAIEFQATVSNGTIVVPEQYRTAVDGVVRVIVLRAAPPAPSKIIARLLATPIDDPHFTPLRRDDIYTRT